MKMKKILSLILAALLLLSLLSCGKDKNRSYDEAEVKAAAQELIKKSERLNKIFWGEGIPYVEEYGYTGYYPADPIYLMENGFLTVDDLKEDAEKVLKSAEANAVNNFDLSRDKLYVAECISNPGPVLKRYIPRARGSASSIKKRTSHITVVLKERV